MLDRLARNRLAEEIRHFFAGRKDNFAFNDAIFAIASEDPAVITIRDQMWYAYDDLQRHKYEGKWRLSDVEWQVVLRSILFLKSDCEYRWSKTLWERSFVALLLTILTAGLARRFFEAQIKNNDKDRIWPFYSIEEFEQAKQNPVYLAINTK